MTSVPLINFDDCVYDTAIGTDVFLYVYKLPIEPIDRGTLGLDQFFQELTEAPRLAELSTVVAPVPDDYKKARFWTSFRFTVEWSIPTDIRYFEPLLLVRDKNTEVPLQVEEEGTPGQPGWKWKCWATEECFGPARFLLHTRKAIDPPARSRPPTLR